jgi:hypothetical protein
MDKILIVGWVVVVLCGFIFVYTRSEVQRILRAESDEPRPIAASIIVPPAFTDGRASENQRIDVTVRLPPGVLSATSGGGGYDLLLALSVVGLFSLAGFTVVLLYNMIVGESRRKLEWGRHLWSEYRRQYTELRDAVDESEDYIKLTEKLVQVRAQAVIPPAVESSITDLIASVKDGQTDKVVAEKRIQALRTLGGFASTPWRYL